MKAILLLLLVMGCEGKQQPRTETDLERARGAISTFKQKLVGELTSAMGRGTPAAIETCRSRAPAIASELSRDGVTVGRATRRARNPANRASGWQADAIAHFETLRARGEALAGAHFTRTLEANKIGYAEPLVIAELCTSCHGKQLAPDVQSALAASYPTDEATGYAVGDLRGVVWVELAR